MKIIREITWIPIKEGLPRIEKGTSLQILVSAVSPHDGERITLAAAFHEGSFYHLEYWIATKRENNETILIQGVTHYTFLPELEL